MYISLILLHAHAQAEHDRGRFESRLKHKTTRIHDMELENPTFAAVAANSSVLMQQLHKSGGAGGDAAVKVEATGNARKKKKVENVEREVTLDWGFESVIEKDENMRGWVFLSEM